MDLCQVCNLLVYLTNSKNKIDYSTDEYNGWFVSSDAIESSNKTVVHNIKTSRNEVEC